ncbi:hypothetical protein GCM10027422_28770 [Hymenobacter arcticus]
MLLTLLLTPVQVSKQTAYVLIAVGLLVAVGLPVLFNWLLKRVFLGNWLKFFLTLMLAGTAFGVIGLCVVG